ncbi:tyrosine-type recombinase/integrase [Serratia marcescens]|uniref:tyrosine-type recombinase/integrase n=1 Tax=Serratia marcescens TaxID=615 RepID=UPI000A54CB04|nr:tyrosine-type recombinase/integrase [Serratia marcescens]
MTKLTDTGRPGKKRYRVTWQGMGGSRTSTFADPCDAYREFYLRERFAWESASEDAAGRKREMTVKELLMFYYGRLCDEVELNRISRSYFKGQGYNFCRLMHKFNRDSPPIRQVSPPDLADITTHNHRLFLQRAYGLAIEVGMCIKNPCRIARKALRYNSAVPPEKFATREQVKILMSLGEALQVLAVYLGAAFGLRISEVAALRWDNIYSDTLVIDSHLTDAGILPGLKYGTRTVFRVSEEFHRLLEQIPRRGKYLFEKKGGGCYANVNSFRRGVLKTLLADAGLTAEGKSFHALRHYAVSEWVSRGIQLEQISRWLDHASPAVTLAVYSHLFSDTQHRCYLFG